MDRPAKRQRSETVLIRLCDKFTRTEVNVICPVIKAENSVRVLYKLQEEMLTKIFRNAGEINDLRLKDVHWRSSPGGMENEGIIFIEYSISNQTDQSHCSGLREKLESELETLLKGRYTLIDEVDNMDQTVPQPFISEFDFELHKLKLFSQELNKERSEESSNFCTIAEITDLVLDELKGNYTKFAVLSQNGKGKSFILNLLLLMTADNQEEYIYNNKNMVLPQDFPDNVPRKKHLDLDPTNLPDVVKDFIKDNANIKDNPPLPICNKLKYDKDTEESVNSFLKIDSYFSTSSKLELEPYVLSQKDAAGSYESTTKCVFHLRYGPCYQMKVEYYGAEELQQQLYELFTTDTDCSHINAEVKEKAEDCLKARYKVLTGREFTEEEHVDCYEDINLYEEVLNFAGKIEFYVGEGKDPTKDRLALQDVLRDLTTAQEEDSDKAEEIQRKIAAVKEILVYLPSKILHGGKEILEMPGTDDSDPIAMFSIRNALNEADAVILVTDFGFKICEKEVKTMLSESGFLQRFQKDPCNNKLMLIAYPEKNLKWQFSRDGKNKIEILDQEARKKKEGELRAIGKMLEKMSKDHEKSIFTTYLLPVLHSSVLSQKDPKPGHEVIAKHSGFLKYTGITDLFIQLDEWVLSRKKSVFDEGKTLLKHFSRAMNPTTTRETARAILQQLQSGEFQSLLKEHNKEFHEKLQSLKGKLLDHVDKEVDCMLKEHIPKAKQQWNAEKDKIISIAAYNPNFIGKNPKFKARLFQIIFEGLEDKKKDVFNNILEGINDVFEKYKCIVIQFYTTELNAFLNPMGLGVSMIFSQKSTDDKLSDAQQRYMGKIRNALNVKTFEKLMDESQKASLKSVILAENYKQGSLEKAKERTEEDIETCVMKVKDHFMKKLFDLHNQRFKYLYTLLWSQKGGSKIWKELEMELKRISRDRSEEKLEQIVEKLQKLSGPVTYLGGDCADEGASLAPLVRNLWSW